MNNYYAQSYGKAQELMYRVFGWMSFALMLTAITSYYVYSVEALRLAIFGNSLIVFGLFIAQIALVVILSSYIVQISYGAALVLFSLYAILSGITLSSIFMIYTMGSIFLTFFVAAAMFATMALYGALTKHDLTSMGSFLSMTLFGMIIVMLVNLFLQSSMLDLLTAMVGVVVFAGLTAWDMQKLKMLAHQIDSRNVVINTIAVIVALQLYLDFINLFLSLLRIMGERKK